MLDDKRYYYTTNNFHTIYSPLNERNFVYIETTSNKAQGLERSLLS